jgi:hypothetical protein
MHLAEINWTLNGYFVCFAYGKTANSKNIKRWIKDIVKTELSLAISTWTGKQMSYPDKSEPI